MKKFKKGDLVLIHDKRHFVLAVVSIATKTAVLLSNPYYKALRSQRDESLFLIEKGVLK